MIRKINNTIATLNTAVLHKSRTVESRYIDKDLMRKMYELNIIKDFNEKKCSYTITKVILEGKVRIYIKNFFRKHSKIFLSRNQILKKRLHLFSTIYLFSTNIGILTQHEMVNKRVGGFLITKITFN
jgi:ribosomal protein S8